MSEVINYNNLRESLKYKLTPEDIESIVEATRKEFEVTVHWGLPRSRPTHSTQEMAPKYTISKCGSIVTKVAIKDTVAPNNRGRFRGTGSEKCVRVEEITRGQLARGGLSYIPGWFSRVLSNAKVRFGGDEVLVDFVFVRLNEIAQEVRLATTHADT